MKTPQDIINFWFSDDMRKRWYRSDAELDQRIAREFSETYEAARNGEFDNWLNDPQGALAMMIVLDQFPRNMFRGSGRSFESNEVALDYARRAIDLGHDAKVKDDERAFFYLPFMHSENLADQDRCLALYEAANDEGGVDYAHRHRDIIKQFGRFPHRNAVLGRESTQEEADFLKTHKGF